MAITTPSAGDAWGTAGGQIITAINNFEGTDAAYRMSGNQTIGTGADTTIAFGTASKTSSLVTRSSDGTGHRFTLGRSGVWLFNVCVRWANAAGGSPGERFAKLNCQAGNLSSQGYMLVSFTGPVTHHVSAVRYMDANDWVRAEAYQDSGGDRNLEGNAGESWGAFYLTWLHA